MKPSEKPMPTTKLTEVTAHRNEVLAKFGVDARKLEKKKFKGLSDTKRAQLLNAPIDSLTTPIVLSPAKPLIGKSNLSLHSCMMVDPAQLPSGIALFSSGYPAGGFPIAQVAFPRIKTGTMHLVEFNVLLLTNMTYQFRVFQYPTADFQDISVPGPKTETLVALLPQVDEISGDLELGASIDQHNSVSEAAGWMLHSALITTTT